MNKQEQKGKAFSRVKSGRRETHINWKYCGSTCKQWDAQYMARAVQNMETEPTFSENEEARADWCQKMQNSS